METIIARIADVNGQTEQRTLEKAGEILRSGGLVIFPTETVYGLGGNALDAAAAGKIYAAKGRPADNPLIVHIASPGDAEQYAVTNATYNRLAEAFMPGPLTVILPVRNSIPKTVTAGLPSVAVRCPVHPVAHALIEKAGVPIAAPSANLSGSPSPTCAAHAIDDMQGRVDMILDGGACDIGVESTIVKVEEDGSLCLLRPGGITPEMLLAVCPHLTIADAVLHAMREGETVLSPGMKYRHYAPKAPVALLDGSPTQKALYIAGQNGRIAVLCYEEELPLFREQLPGCDLYSIGAAADTGMQAHRLFSLLREADKVGYDRIFAPLPSPHGMGMALYNRMIRAAAHTIINL